MRANVSEQSALDRFFGLTANGSNLHRELLGGCVTFLAMSYIIFLQPAVLSGQLFGSHTGLDFGAVMTATCLAAALATAIMALYARYPIAQAPGMGENFFFVLTVVPAAAAAGVGEGWQVALGVVFLSGVLFVLVSLFGLRELILDAISPGMKNAIAVGIGLFIALIGFQNAGLVRVDQTLSMNPNLASPDLLVFFFGLLLTAVLQIRGVRGSILWGIMAATLLALLLRLLLPASPAVAESMLLTRFEVASRLVSSPPSLAPTFLKMDIAGALTLPMLPFILIFFVMDVFDTTGTLVGVSQHAGFMRDGRLPRASRAMLSDAVGTVTGACLGTSTVTSFIESATGIDQGARTGLAGLVTAALFLLALFVSPLVAMVGSYPPITAPALVIVGALMVRSVVNVDWSDLGEALPALLVMLGIPATYSIADGIALGLIAHPLLKLAGGKHREIHWIAIVMAVLLLLYYAFVRAAISN